MLLQGSNVPETSDSDEITEDDLPITQVSGL